MTSNFGYSLALSIANNFESDKPLILGTNLNTINESVRIFVLCNQLCLNNALLCLDPSHDATNHLN